MAKKICIDAGHYGKYNRSPAVKEYYESDMTWKLHKLLKKYLEEYGFKVIVTRDSKAADKALYDRGKTSKGCDLFISLHSNAVGTGVNESVDRVDIYASLSGKAHDLAKKLANCIVTVMGTRQGGNVKTRKGSTGGEYYGVLRGAAAVGTPGLLIEHSFHTCTRSAKWLMDEANLDKLARAEAKVLAEHYGMTGGSKEPEKVEAEKPKAEKPEATKPVDDAFEPYLVKITTDVLNVRKGAGTKYDIATTIKEGEVYTIVQEKKNGSTKWGKLKSGAGWISLQYTKKV